ncbi:MAG: hypothetical protein ACOVQR_10835 [Flavobacterium sp.]|jgi:hypothetical protein|uniref:hypothetical protein n=1 Tax=Flavobacterium sp. TaxID=239 RepID=UPI003BA613BD
MKGVFKENKDLVFLKEEFSTFVKKKKQNPTDKTKKASTPQKEELVFDEVEL